MSYTSTRSVPFEIPDINHGLKRAKGLFKLEKDGIELEYQLQDSFIGVIKSEIKNFHLPYGELKNIRFEKGWFRTKIILEATSIRTFENLPGADHAVCTLRVKRKNWKEARDVVSKAMMQLSEYKLDQLGNDDQGD